MKKHEHEQNHGCTDSCCSHEHEHDHGCTDSCCSHEHEHEHEQNHGCTDSCCSHEHHHDHGCGCCADDDDIGCSCCSGEHEEENTKFEWIRVAVSAVLMGVGIWLLHIPEAAQWMYYAGIAASVAAYLICGYKTLISSVKSLFSGSFRNIFNENLLMSVATICAMIIGEFSEAAAVMVLFRLGELLQDIAVSRSRRSIKATLSLCADTARLIDEDGSERITDPDDVSVGQTVLVRPGERVPLDGVAQNACLMDYAAITGESVPVAVSAGETVISGGICLESPVKLSVSALFHDSTASRILRTVESAREGKPRLESFIRRFSRYYTPAVMALALVIAALVPWLISVATASDVIEWSKWIERGLLFLVVSCPCALVISVPLTFFSGLSRGAREGILFKSADMIESLSSVRVMAFDKTGTLTCGTFRVTEINAASDFTETDVLCSAGALERDSIHPIARAIYNEALSRDEFSGYSASEYAEELGHGVGGVVNGKHITVGNREYMEMQGVDMSGFSERAGAIYVSCDKALMGEIIISDVIRTGSADAVKTLHAQGRKTVLLTGDSLSAAIPVAHSTGIADEDVHAHLMPDEKLAILQDMRKTHGKVAFLGDGTNDAPVLAGSDVGLVMGAMGTDAAIESGDVLIMGDDISSVPKAFSISKRVTATARTNIAVALAIKAAAMVLGVFGLLQMWMAVIADVGATLLCVLIATAATMGGKSK